MTRYTQFIKDGRITKPQDFLKLCLRAFGIMAEDIDESLSLESVVNKKFDIEEDTHYKYLKNQMVDTCVALDKMRQLQQNGEARDEAYANYVNQISYDIEHYANLMKERIAQNEVYRDMAAKINKWECSPEYQEIKQFAIDQCLDAIEDNGFYEKEIERARQTLLNPKESFNKYVDTAISIYEESVDTYTKKINDYRLSVEKKRKFFENFMAEVNNIKD